MSRMFHLCSAGKRHIKSLRVTCSYVDDGCGWKGEVGNADQHIEQCVYRRIVCPNMCKDSDGKEIMILQKDVQKHLEKECERRLSQCPHCKEKGEYKFITGMSMAEFKVYLKWWLPTTIRPV